MAASQSKSRLPFQSIIALRRNVFPGVQRPGLPAMGFTVHRKDVIDRRWKVKEGKNVRESWLNRRRGNWEGAGP